MEERAVERQRSLPSNARRRCLCEECGHGWPLLESALARNADDLRTTPTGARSWKIAKEAVPPQCRCASNDLEPWVQVGESAGPSGFPHEADMHTGFCVTVPGRL